MSTTGVGIGGVAVVRAADAMLNALGGDELVLVFPQVTLPDDPSAQLGLVDPGVEQLTLSPIVVRTLTTPSTGPRRKLEFLISSSAVSAAVISQNAATAEALFDNALGVMYGSDLFHIAGVTAEYFAGTPYLYKVTGVE